jgi:FKBP-type peptidyl-prolyl cis-trans isomerase FkpA
MTEPNGVRYTIQTTGTGVTPTLNSYLVVTYKLKLLKNKSVVDQGTNVMFPLSDLIIGWKTVLPLIPAGSKITLYVPSGLGYGGNEKIDPIDHTVIMPANSNLIFEIELVRVQ